MSQFINRHLFSLMESVNQVRLWRINFSSKLVLSAFFLGGLAISFFAIVILLPQNASARASTQLGPSPEWGLSRSPEDRARSYTYYHTLVSRCIPDSMRNTIKTNPIQGEATEPSQSGGAGSNGSDSGEWFDDVSWRSYVYVYPYRKMSCADVMSSAISLWGFSSGQEFLSAMGFSFDKDVPHWEFEYEDIVSNEAKEIAELARSLANYFEETWDDSKDNLLEWQQELTKIDFQAHTEELSKIVHFLDSNFDLNSELKVFLIQNPPNRLSSGHMIKRSDFILLHPPTRPYAKNTEHIATALLHEYTHAIEFSSNSTRELFKNSFNKHILHSGVVKPAGITWNMFYAEIIVYYFANNITGGYLKPEIYKEPRPSVEEMQDSFWRLVKSGKHNDNHIISWIALNILNDVESYIQEGKVIDETSADKISLLILEFYSKHQHLK